MISLQSHNQVLYHLMQLSSAVGSRSTPSATKPKRQNGKTIFRRTEEMSESSSTEVAQSCLVLPLAKLNATDVFIHKVKKNNVWIMLDDLSVLMSKRPPEKDSKWTISYISGSSFKDNKQGVPNFQIQDMILIPPVHFPHYQQKRLLHSLHDKLSRNHMQLRGFKSRRLEQPAKEEREAAQTSNVFTPSSAAARWFRAATAPDKPKYTLPGNGKISSIDDIEKIFTPEMPAVEKNRIRSALLLGYELGIKRKRPSFVRNMGGVFVVMMVLLSVYYFGSVSSVFKMSMGSAAEVDPEEINVTFDDVKGVDQAKRELTEVVEFLKNPDKFVTLGGKLPKGILLVGEPGTGKTLLARAVAGEAGVPFFHAAGPEFDEVLVGQGARRLRDLFRAAKEKAPCVVFIDEIDSIGSKRTNSALHPYANQTINQLLTEMDGFHQNDGVIVLGATNRRNDLDKAILRPGRFDVEVKVDKPDFKGRLELWKLYLSKIISQGVDPEYLARNTSGYTGADIENMVNQAALRAAIESAEFVNMVHMEYARDKVMMGPAGPGKVPNENVNVITAYHEGGHALVAFYTKHALPIHKVTIIPRGHSLGHTAYLPEKDQYLTTKAEFLAKLDVSMGGRAAEEIMFGNEYVTTGAHSDLMVATRLAEDMVKNYGMSDKVGLRIVASTGSSEYSETTTEMIDTEVKRILQESYERAKSLLKSHSKELKAVAEALLKYETLDAEELAMVANGKKLEMDKFTASSNRVTPDESGAPTKNILI